jgi:hypothetical protein
MKVIGNENFAKATAGIFYDDFQNPRTGGTGHAMWVCDQEKVEVLTQEIWFEWL